MLIKLPFEFSSKAYSRFSIGAIHAGITFIIFAPYFISGQMPLWSSDNLYGSLPMFPYGLESISQGWSGWLPYSASGSDFSGNVGNFTYSPFFLPAVLFGEEGIWHYVAFLEIFSFWAIGFLFFLICGKIIEDRGWALFASILFQLSLVTLFTLQTFPNTLIYACFLLACNVMWRLDSWGPKTSLSVLVFSFYSMITSGHFVYAFYWGFFLGVLFIYRHGLHPLDLFKKFSPTQIFVLSVTIAVIISAVRLYPILNSLGGTSRGFESVLYGHFTRFFVGLFLFIPEAFGIVLHDTLGIAARTSGYFGGAFQYGGNQHMFFHFVGVLTAFFIVIGFFSKYTRGALFWKWLVFLYLAFDFWIIPISLLFNLFFHPFQHMSMVFGIGFPLAILAGYVGQELTKGFAIVNDGKSLQNKEKTKLSPLFMSSLIICSVTLYLVTAYGFAVYQADWDRTKATILAVKFILFAPLVLSFLIYAYRHHPKLGPFYVRLSLLLFCVALFALLVFGMATAYLGHVGLQALLGRVVNPSGNSEIFVQATILNWMSILFILFIGGLIFFRPDVVNTKTIAALAVVFGILMCIQWIAPPGVGVFQAAMQAPSRIESEILVVTGGARFVLVFFVLMLIFYSMEKGKLKTGVFSIISCTLVFMVMVPVFKEFSHFVTRPFLNVEDGMLYPPRAEYDGLDLKNYRVNFPHQLVPRSEIYQPITGHEEITNINLIYRLPTYGSLNSMFTPLDMKFLQELGEATPYFGQSSDLTDSRFLDLSGVRYDFGHQNMVERPGALSRFMFFTDYEVIREGDETLKRLKEPTFAPTKKIIVDQNVGLTNTRTAPARKIEYSDTSYDDLSLNLNTTEGGILLFNDTFSPGWEAWVDGVGTQILHANYKFMGIYVSEGSHEINFIYRPPAKRIGLFVSGFGMIFLLGVLLWPSTTGIRSPRLDPRG